MVGCSPVSYDLTFPDELRVTDLYSGAVHRGLEGNQVQTRKARCHYGVSMNYNFDRKKHDATLAYWDIYIEKWRVPGCMTWFIKTVRKSTLSKTFKAVSKYSNVQTSKGDTISEQDPLSHSVFRNVPLNFDFRFKDTLSICTKEESPAMENKGILTDITMRNSD